MAFAISEYMTVQLVYEKPAVKALTKLQPKVARAIRDALRVVAADPFAHQANVDRLTGTKDSFWLRHGSWRVLYRLDRATDTMIVEAIEPRGEAYKQ